MLEVNRAELAALEKRLADIADNIAKKVLRGAVRKAMNKVRKTARMNAQQSKDTGLLDENFGLTTSAKDGEIIAKVGIRGGGKENETTPFYFRFVELGTKDAPAKPFLRPALENNAQDVLDTVVDELKKALDKVQA